VLSPEEIHKLASKTKKAVAGDADKASCHSDYVPAQQAESIQRERLVQLRSKAAGSKAADPAAE
jgi:phosphomethylpyrimidine synthase